MIIRAAIPEDKNSTIRLLKSAHSAAGFGDGRNPMAYPFQAAYAERSFLLHLHSDDALCLVLERNKSLVGILMARAFDYELGPVRVAKETVWWIDEAHRGTSASKMMDEYETWAKSRGCAAVGMASLEVNKRAAIIYARRGYEPAETHHIKPL